MSELLLSTAYLPNMQYIRAIAEHKAAMVEQWESFPKQTYRNRCEIATPGGRMTLTVPVVTMVILVTLLLDWSGAAAPRWSSSSACSLEVDIITPCFRLKSLCAQLYHTGFLLPTFAVSKQRLDPCQRLSLHM